MVAFTWLLIYSSGILEIVFWVLLFIKKTGKLVAVLIPDGIYAPFLKRSPSTNRKGSVLLYISILLDKIFKQQFNCSKRDFHFHQGYLIGVVIYSSILNTKHHNKIRFHRFIFYTNSFKL